MRNNFCESRCLWAIHKINTPVKCGMPRGCDCPIVDEQNKHAYPRELTVKTPNGTCFFCKREYPKHKLINRPEGWLCRGCYHSREYRLYRDECQIKPLGEFDVFCTSCGSIVSIYDVDKNGVCSLCSERKNMMLYRV